MFNITTSIPEIDKENLDLIRASDILERIGNEPNPTATQFYAQLVVSDYPQEEHQEITMAAISIETMMGLEMLDEDFAEPTVH